MTKEEALSAICDLAGRRPYFVATVTWRKKLLRPYITWTSVDFAEAPYSVRWLQETFSMMPEFIGDVFLSNNLGKVFFDSSVLPDMLFLDFRHEPPWTGKKLAGLIKSNGFLDVRLFVSPSYRLNYKECLTAMFRSPVVSTVPYYNQHGCVVVNDVEAFFEMLKELEFDPRKVSLRDDVPLDALVNRQ